MNSSFQEAPDFAKILNEWALAAGHQLKSKQTSYVHYHPSDNTFEGRHDTIPLFENTLFALALLRSRLVESIQEAKGLLARLLSFQNQQEGEAKGQFPLYLHDYPSCHDWFASLQLLPPFYWILKQFGHILGSDLRKRLEQTIPLVLEGCHRHHLSSPLPYSKAICLAAAQFAFGTLWEKKIWKEEGEQLLDQLSQTQLEEWINTSQLAELIVGLQMVYPSLPKSPWRDLWLRMEQTWHQSTGGYIGPCLREWQEGEEPQPHLYDLYAGYFSRKFSHRATLLRPYHLQGVLIQPTMDQFVYSPSLVVKGKIKRQDWLTSSHPSWAYTLIEKKGEANPALDKTFTPFRFIWGNLEFLHSFVCQGGHYEKVKYVIEGNAIHLLFSLGLPQEEERKEREIEFFVNFHPDVRLTLGNHPVNTFELGQTLYLSLGPHTLSVLFSLVEGEGDFFGHLMRGNRPSQINHKQLRHHQAYDWTFFLRTIRRQGPCQVRATFISPIWY